MHSNTTLRLLLLLTSVFSLEMSASQALQGTIPTKQATLPPPPGIKKKRHCPSESLTTTLAPEAATQKRHKPEQPATALQQAQTTASSSSSSSSSSSAPQTGQSHVALQVADILCDMATAPCTSEGPTTKPDQYAFALFSRLTLLGQILHPNDEKLKQQYFATARLCLGIKS